jgi:cobalamin synthase
MKTSFRYPLNLFLLALSFFSRLPVAKNIQYRQSKNAQVQSPFSVSRIGTYGTCALVLVLLSKFILLSALAEQGSLVVSLFIAYHCLGQWQSA